MSRRKGIRENENPTEIYAAALKNSPEAEALVRAYQQNIPETPKAKAEAEAKIWEKLLAEDKRSIIRINGYNSTFLAHVLGVESPNAFIARGRTLGWERRGAKVDLAWRAIIEGKNSWVIKAITYAKKAADEHEDHLAGKMAEESVTLAVNHKFEAALLAYKNDPRIHDEEKRVNRETNRERKVKDSPKATTTPAKKTRAIDEILVSGDIQEPKDIWDEAELLIKEKVNPFVRSRLSTFDSESGVDDVLNTFYLDLRNVYQDLLTKIRRMRALKSSQAILEVKREKIRWALETLRMPVQRGWRKEDLNADAIKKQYRSLVLRFHPDKPTSDEVTRARFAEVKDAYEVLRDAGLNI